MKINVLVCSLQTKDPDLSQSYLNPIFQTFSESPLKCTYHKNLTHISLILQPNKSTFSMTLQKKCTHVKSNPTINKTDLISRTHLLILFNQTTPYITSNAAILQTYLTWKNSKWWIVKVHLFPIMLQLEFSCQKGEMYWEIRTNVL